MKSPVIVEALRTPIGRARKGSLVGKDAFELAQTVVAAVLERTKIDPGEIDAVEGETEPSHHLAVQIRRR